MYFQAKNTLKSNSYHTFRYLLYQFVKLIRIVDGYAKYLLNLQQNGDT